MTQGDLTPPPKKKISKAGKGNKTGDKFSPCRTPTLQLIKLIKDDKLIRDLSSSYRFFLLKKEKISLTPFCCFLNHKSFLQTLSKKKKKQ